MKYYKNILQYIFPVWMLIGISICGDLDIDLTLLNTSQFNLINWEDIDELWYVDVHNTSSQGIDYILEFTLNKGSDELVLGRTKLLFIAADDTRTYKNNDSELDTDALTYYWEDADFKSNIEFLGYLPPGNYTLNIEAFGLQDNLLSSDQETLTIPLGDQFSLVFPDENQNMGGSDLIFRWNTPGFRQGIRIEFRLIIAAIVPGETDTKKDAIDKGYSSVFFFDSNWNEFPMGGAPWPYIETGISQELNTSYSSLLLETNDPLICGYDYAWRIEAREVIEGYSGGGIWGWPESQQSTIWKFSWGNNPTGLEPPDGDDVLPTFEWNQIWCAYDGYDFEISLSDDLEFNNPIWNIMGELTSSYTYPNDAPGLIPGASYHWRVRIHSFNGKTIWSNSENLAINSIEIIEPLPGTTNIESVRPTFNIDAPKNIGHYTIKIGDENDENVDIAEIYDEKEDIMTFPWQYPSNVNDIDNGLFPGMIYYWKLLMYDHSGDLLGTIEDYEVMGNFSIIPIILYEPTNNAQNIPLNQRFKWDGPTSVPEYEFQISGEEDPGLDYSQATIKVIGSESLVYPYDGDFPLEYETNYYWRIIPKDIHGFPGPQLSYSSVYQFTTTEYAELVGPLSGSIIETVRPTFEINTPIGISYLTFKISDETDENIENSQVYNEEEKIFPSSSNFVSWKYPNQDIDYGLHPGMKYYWQYLMYDSDDQLIGEVDDYEIMFFTIEEINLKSPEQGAKNIPLNQIFSWEGPLEVPEYEFWISGAEDPDLDNPELKIEGIAGNTLEYPYDGDFPLEYEKKYNWRVVPKDINGNYGLVSSYSDVFQFTASDFPIMEEEVSPSSSDPRIPIINIKPLEGLTYTIFIYSDPDGSSIIDELNGITEFPYEYTQGEENFQYGVTYYLQVQPMQDGEIFGPPSIMMPFSIPEVSVDEPSDDTQQCTISCEITDNVAPEILTTILEGIEGATEYLILLSENEDMSDPVEIIISSGESQYVIPSEHVEWGQTYYTQVIALSDDESIGLPSNIQMINVASRPGMDEKAAISVTLSEGSTKPAFEIIKEINGATGYTIIVSTESDMSVEFWQFDLSNSTSSYYPNDGPALQYGQSYYVTAQALDGENLHGIISNIVGFFIPNITPPALGEAFSWEASVPPADQYLLEVSLVEDFSAIVINTSVQGSTYPMKMDELEYSTGYYWRVQGLGSNGEYFGNSSQIKFFKTEGIPAPTLNVISEEVSLTPELTWSGIEMAAAYQIAVSSDESMENILWQENMNNTSAIYPESAILLDFATTYYWQVIVLDENDSPLSESTVESFSTKSVYAVVGLPDGGTETLTPKLQWEANDKISFYLVIIASDSEMENVILNETIDNNSLQIDVGILSSGMKYYWLVDGLDENGKSLAGPSNIVSLIMPSSNSISLLLPIGDEQVTNLKPTLKWSGLLGVSSYALKIGTDPELESTIVNTMISGTETVLSDENRLNNSMTYFWQVQGSTEDAVDIVSPIGSFSTSASAAITIQSLEDNASISVTNPVFSWETGEEIAAFSIRFDDKADFSESWNFRIGSTNFEYPGEPPLNFETPYYWQVNPLDNEGNPIGEWTPSRSFSISAAFIVELELPGNGEIATTSNPTFRWSAIEGAAKYEIQVSSGEDFSEILWTSSEIVENSTAYPGSGAEKLSYGQTYYWRVRALGEESPLGDFSSMFSFDLSGKNKVVLEGPLSEESETLFPYFSWETVNGASGYTLTLAADESIATIIYIADVSEVFLQYPDSAPPLSNGITYYWNILAKDENGSSIGDISDVGSFITPTGTIEIEFIFGTE